MFPWWVSWRWVFLVAVWTSCGGAPNSDEAALEVWPSVGLEDLQSELADLLEPMVIQGNIGPGMGGSAVDMVAPEGGQSFATQPTPQTAVVGSTVVLPCRVINKVGHLQWTKDGFGMGTRRALPGFARYNMIGSDDEGDFSLRIQPVLLEDDGMYQCQVSAGDGIPGIRSRTARLTVYVSPEPPRVHPPVLQATAGMTITLECESRGGRPAPEIQWVDDSRREIIKSGTSLTTEEMADGKRVNVKSRLTFTPQRSHHNNTVTCLTSNQALSSPLASSIQLRVFFPPEVQLYVRPKILVEGDDATIFCTAKANPNIITYRWYHNQEVLDNETRRSLTIKNIPRSFHQGAVSCEVSNKVGTSKKTQTMHVQYGPRFKTSPRDKAAESGKEVVLECDVDSNPTSSIVWYQEGSKKVIGSGRELRVVVSGSTAGVYRCVASVRGFPDLTGHMRVLLKGPPLIVSSSDQQGRMGDTVTLECSTVSIPSPIRVTWTYKGREIDLSDPRYEVVQDQQGEGLRNVLVIHDADTRDFGSYNCSVVNEYGVARKLIRLNEEKRIPVLLLVGGGLAAVLVLVLAVSLVVCNKRNPTVKADSSNSLKPSPHNEVSGVNVDKLFPAEAQSSDTQLSQAYTSTTTTTAASSNTRQYDHSTPSEESSTRQPAHHHTNHTTSRLAARSRDSLKDTGQSNSRSQGGQRQRGYVSFVDYEDRDYTPLPNGRRASYGDLREPYSSLDHTSSTNDYCTLRKTNTRTRDLNYGTALSPVSVTNYHNSSTRLLNGDTRRYSQHSLYSPTFGSYYVASPPPPYTTSRTRKLGSPMDFSSPPEPITLSLTSSDLHLDRRDSKYIFSPEAIMKPGTLV